MTLLQTILHGAKNMCSTGCSWLSTKKQCYYEVVSLVLVSECRSVDTLTQRVTEVRADCSLEVYMVMSKVRATHSKVVTDVNPTLNPEHRIGPRRGPPTGWYSLNDHTQIISRVGGSIKWTELINFVCLNYSPLTSLSIFYLHPFRIEWG